MSNEDPMIVALLRERDGYRRTGREARAAQVDEQLQIRGYEEKPDPRREKPRGRSARPRQDTTEAPVETASEESGDDR